MKNWKIATAMLMTVFLSSCRNDIIQDAPPEGQQQAVILELASEEAQDLPHIGTVK